MATAHGQRSVGMLWAGSQLVPGQQSLLLQSVAWLWLGQEHGWGEQDHCLLQPARKSCHCTELGWPGAWQAVPVGVPLLLHSLLFASHSVGKCGWGIPSFPLTSSFHVTGQLFCLHDRQLEVQLEPCLPCGVPLLRGAWCPWDRGEHGRSGAVQEGIEPPAQLLHVEKTFKALRSFFYVSVQMRVYVFSSETSAIWETLSI